MLQLRSSNKTNVQLTSSVMTPEEALAAGAELKKARINLGLSQREVAKRTGLDQTTIGRFERGEVSQPLKLAVVQRDLRVGPYAVDVPPTEVLELMLEELALDQITTQFNTALLNTLALTKLSTHQLLALIQDAAQVLAERLDTDEVAATGEGHAIPDVASDLVITGWMAGEAPAWSDGQQSRA